MSWIRILGLVVACGLLVFSWLGRKKGALSRGDVCLLLVMACGLFAVTAYPTMLNGLLLFKQQSRVVTLLVVAQFAFLGLLVRLTIRGNRMKRYLRQLVHNLAVRDFSREFGSTADYTRKILVIIPAFNEAVNLPYVLERMPREVLDYQVEVIVAVDGATDETEEVVRKLDFPAVVNQIKSGGGAALKAGYDLAMRHNAEIVVTMDADGQHDPEEIPKLVGPIIQGEADFVSGSRILGSQEGGALMRQMGILFFNRFVSFLLGKKITDCSNAFRAIRASELSKLELREDQFHTTEVLIEAISKGLRFTEIPITIRQRWYGESKKPPSLSYGMGFFRAIMRAWLRT